EFVRRSRSTLMDLNALRAISFHLPPAPDDPPEDRLPGELCACPQKLESSWPLLDSPIARLSIPVPSRLTSKDTLSFGENDLAFSQRDNFYFAENSFRYLPSH